MENKRKHTGLEPEMPLPEGLRLKEEYRASGTLKGRIMERAKRERRKPEEMPHISAHVLRHTACTRMAETDLDIKVVQYVMGHANISVTMDVYNHVTDQERIVREIAKLDEVQVM